MVSLNVEYYAGEDLYSDGEIENDLLRFAEKYADPAVFLAQDGRWPVLYHFSPVRRNLLEWFDFEQSGTLLEIGAGCGALTGLFCEKVRQVTAVELSKKRAQIIAERHKHLQNLEIYVGNMMDMKFPTKFHYITCIGVLEYASSYVNLRNPFSSFLDHMKAHLADDGLMIIAIENKFGIKYWAGAREDHTGRLFDSIEGYPGTQSVATFSKHELTQLIQEAGLEVKDFYYPMPDYKFPTQVFSDDCLPSPGQIELPRPLDRERYTFFNEKLAIESICSSQSFDFFSNSFLVVCRKAQR